MWIYRGADGSCVEVREVGTDARWKSNPLSHADAIARIIQYHGALNPLFEAPWVTTAIFKMDWLHCADQGVTADFIGNALYHFVDSFPGDTKEARYDALFQEVVAYYDANGVADRMDCLRPTFIESRQGMKLRCSAAKCRHLVPFVAQLARELCDMRDPVEEAIHRASHHLLEAYNALSSSAEGGAGAMAEHGTKFALQYVALHDRLNHVDERTWKVKPKMHLFLHLCLDGGDPAKHWCYRDEDFGGSVARCARRRGGMCRPMATSYGVLTRMAIQTPRIVVR